MNSFTAALTAALVDFVWQGMLVAIPLAVGLRVFRRASPQLRYRLCAVALLILVALPPITAVWRYSASAAGPMAVSVVGQPLQTGGAEEPAVALIGVWRDAPAELVALQGSVVPMWLLGVALVSLRLAIGSVEARTLRRSGVPAGAMLSMRLTSLATRMRIDRSIHLVTSMRVESPSTIGWLRPLILLPPATAMGLTPEQLDAVLAHELAHIRRHDYLINFCQMIVETLLFYHPAVWWVSNRLRIERELCCDDEAVQACGDATAYAKALVTIARLQVPTIVISSAGGSLSERVHRLLGFTQREPQPSPAWGLVALGTLLASIAVVVGPARVTAQGVQNATAPARFEVASVKANLSGDSGRMLGPAAGGRFVATNVTLRQLIAFAFGISNPRSEMLVIEGPRWLDADRFDVQAVAAGGNIPRGQTGPLVRALLEERFQLRAHLETRERPIYHLMVDRGDGRLGPGLRPSAANCTVARCGLMSAPGMLAGLGVTMSAFAESVAPFAGRVVVDRTDLEQAFDIEVKWADGAANPPVAADMPGLFTALREQLGLKLEDARGPVDVVVVDSASPLTAN